MTQAELNVSSVLGKVPRKAYAVAEIVDAATGLSENEVRGALLSLKKHGDVKQNDDGTYVSTTGHTRPTPK